MCRDSCHMFDKDKNIFFFKIKYRINLKKKLKASAKLYTKYFSQ